MTNPPLFCVLFPPKFEPNTKLVSDFKGCAELGLLPNVNGDVDNMAVVDTEEFAVVGTLATNALCSLLSTALVVAMLQVTELGIGEENAMLLLVGVILDADETFSVVCGWFNRPTGVMFVFVENEEELADVVEELNVTTAVAPNEFPDSTAGVAVETTGVEVVGATR